MAPGIACHARIGRRRPLEINRYLLPACWLISNEPPPAIPSKEKNEKSRKKDKGQQPPQSERLAGFQITRSPWAPAKELHSVNLMPRLCAMGCATQEAASRQHFELPACLSQRPASSTMLCVALLRNPDLLPHLPRMRLHNRVRGGMASTRCQSRQRMPSLGHKSFRRNHASISVVPKFSQCCSSTPSAYIPYPIHPKYGSLSSVPPSRG